MARTSSPGSIGPSSSRDLPFASAERMSSRFATLFEGGTATRLSASGRRRGVMGRRSSIRGARIMSADAVHPVGARGPGRARRRRARVRDRRRGRDLPRRRWNAGRGGADRDAHRQATGRENRPRPLLRPGGALPERGVGIDREGRSRGRIARPRPGIRLRRAGLLRRSEGIVRLRGSAPRRDGVRRDPRADDDRWDVQDRPQVHDDGRQAHRGAVVHRVRESIGRSSRVRRGELPDRAVLHRGERPDDRRGHPRARPPVQQERRSRSRPGRDRDRDQADGAAQQLHYYRYDTREDATLASVYWLLRSGKPVLVISLAGQHGPVLVGFEGAYGTYYDDPANKVSGVIVEDPQRGDMDPRTQSHRPDKYRTPGFQTGQP